MNQYEFRITSDKGCNYSVNVTAQSKEKAYKTICEEYPRFYTQEEPIMTRKAHYFINEIDATK